MTCGFSSTRRTQIETRIARWETQLDIAYAAMDDLVGNPLDEYRLDTAEGKQWATRRKVMELQKTIDILERKIDHWTNRLAGKGIIYHDVRRRG